MWSPQSHTQSPRSPLSGSHPFAKNENNFSFPNKKSCPGSKSTFDGDSLADLQFFVSEAKWNILHDQLQSSSSTRINRYCPFCGRFVHQIIGSFGWKNQSLQTYFLSHKNCKDDSVNFTEYKNQSEITEKIIMSPQQVISIGSQEYLINVAIEHPLSRVKYFSLDKKVSFNGENLFLDFDRVDVSQLFTPNIVILPLSQFKITVTINGLKKSELAKESLYFYIDLDKSQSKTTTLQSSNEHMLILTQFTRIFDQQQKANLVNSSNFKIFHDYNQGDLVIFNKCAIYLKEMAKTSSSCQIPDSENQQFELEINQTVEVKVNPVQTTEYEDLEYINYIKTHTGSKEFQKKVKVMSGEEISVVVQKLLPYLQEVILNEYGNYMFQSLISACNLDQRYRILLTIKKRIPDLVCQQQGTFVFQQFVTYLTNEEEFFILCEEIKENFYRLCLDNYGNHFMRKFIQNLPHKLLSVFLEQTIDYFIEFSMNKNAICVLKSFLRTLKGTEEENALEFQKKFIISLTINTQTIIKNQYGNYLIQEAFELLGSKVLSGINETIIRLFSILGCQKYSSNVLQQCIRKYWWADQELYEELKASLNNKKILVMYRNHNGNRVLLQIMETAPSFQLKEKISSCVGSDKPSKYNNNKWVHLRGSRWTGVVGTNYASFSEAVSSKKGPNYNNNMM